MKSTARRARSGSFQHRRQRVVLAGILAVYLGLAALYAWSVPKWNAPDEPGHYNYVKTIATTGTFPILRPGDYDFNYLEKAKAARFPDSLAVDPIRYESHQPPLYYLLAAPILALSQHLALDVQVTLLRMITALFGAATIIVTYGIGRRIFPDDAVLPLAAAAFVAFVPMHVFMNAATTNDSLANLLLSSLIFALVASITERGRADANRKSARPNPTRREEPGSQALARPHFDRDALVWGGLLGLGLLTKSTTYIGIALVAIVIIWQDLVAPLRGPSNARTQAISIARPIWRMAQAYGFALVLAGWWFARNAIVYGNLDIFGMKQHDLVVAGQPLTGPLTISVVKHFVVTSFKSFWGVFGWMGVFMDERIYLLLALLSAIAFLGFVLGLRRYFGRGSELSVRQKAALGVVAAGFALLTMGVLQYNLTYVQAQGRYFFPAIASIAIFFTLGLRELVDERHGGTVFTLLFLVLIALDYLSLYRFIIPQLVP